MSTACAATWRSTSTDGFRKTRVTHRRPRPSQRSGRERIDGIRWEWEGSARIYRTHVRVRQTRTGLRPDGHDGDRPAAADADEHPCQTPNRGVSPASPLRVGQAARLPATEQIRAAAQEEHREEQQRDLRKGRGRHRHHFRVLADGPCRSPTPARLIPRARTSNVYSTPMFQIVDHHTARGHHLPVCPLVVVGRVGGIPGVIGRPPVTASQTSRRASGPALWAVKPVGAAGGPCR